MKFVLTMMSMLLVSGCATVNRDALCDGTAQARDELAAALVEDGGSRSILAGDHLIRLLDAGCKES